MYRLFLAALLILPGPCLAQTGGVVVRIPDGTSSRCINPVRDKIWLTLRRLVTTKASGWFTSENSVAVIVNALVKTDPSQSKPIAFPLASEATFGDAPNGQVSLPIEYTVVSGLRLSLPNDQYISGLDVDITLLNKKSKNKWGSALATLSSVTKGLPIPASPLTQSASYLMDFANQAVDADLSAQASDDKVKSATLAMNFDSSGKCNGDFESTGTIALIQAQGAGGPDLVSIDKPDSYCWRAQLKPAFIVEAAKLETGFNCDDTHYQPLYRAISNNYVGFFVNAIGSTGTAGKESAALQRDTRQSLSRCTANGIAQDRCLIQ
jgi:hypothetical protein